MNQYRLLVTSVDAWNSRVGSDTMSSLVSVFPSEMVASLNIRAKKSDSTVAGRYFHIVEGRVMRSISHPSEKTGEAYTVESGDVAQSIDEEKENKRYTQRKKCGRGVLVLLRELVWKLGHWKTKELDAFLDDTQLDALFFPIESYIHFNRINQYIIDKYHPKRVVGYMWDDNFTYKQHPHNLLYMIHRYWLRKSVKKLIGACDVVFAISPKLKRELDAEYGTESVLLTKPMKEGMQYVPYSSEKPIRMLYTGKLNIGRDRAVAEIADAMREVNKDETKVVLDVYTDTPLMGEVKRRIEASAECRIHGFVPQHEVIEKQRQADVLLFVEALSSRDMSARLSFSTKLTDYLSAGKCVWAVGNKDLAPIEYLRENNAAVVSTKKEEVLAQLRKIIDNKETIPYYAQKAFECGQTNHNKDMIQKRFISAITGTNWGG